METARRAGSAAENERGAVSELAIHDDKRCAFKYRRCQSPLADLTCNEVRATLLVRTYNSESPPSFSQHHSMKLGSSNVTALVPPQLKPQLASKLRVTTEIYLTRLENSDSLLTAFLNIALPFAPLSSCSIPSKIRSNRPFPSLACLSPTIQPRRPRMLFQSQNGPLAHTQSDVDRLRSCASRLLPIQGIFLTLRRKAFF